LIDPDLDSTATVATFPSEVLNELCDEGQESLQSLLRTTMTTCTVLPSDTLLPMHHSNEGTTITTLLSGSIVWIIWPPTSKNIRSLQTAYEILAEGSDVEPNTATDFEGGMILVQTEGDGLRIPPHSVMMALATSTSVLATYSEVTVENFITMLQNLPLLKTWFQTELDGYRKQSEFTASILRHLDLLLNGSPDEEANEDSEVMIFDHPNLSRAKGGSLDTLFTTWDHVKNELAAMMGPADHETMENIWQAFLIDFVGRECRICGKHIWNKEKLMKKHFIESHWSKFHKTKRHDSRDVLEKDRDHAHATEQMEKLTEGDGEDDFVTNEDPLDDLA
jgi:hypothetical protein